MGKEPVPNERTGLVKQIDLGDLGNGRVPRVPRSLGKFYEKAAVVRLESQDHVPGVTLKVERGASQNYTVYWTTVSDQTRRLLDYADTTTENGALGIAFVIINRETGYAVDAVHGRAGGGGFDYWLVDKTSSEFKARLEISGLQKGTTQQIKSVFEDLLTSHTHEEVSNSIRTGRRYAAPSRTITEGDWKLEGWLVPITKPTNSFQSGQIVIYPFNAAFTNVVNGVRNAINGKRNRYGKLSAPLVVAVNVRDPFYNGRDNDLAILLGGEVISYPVGNPDASGMLIHKNNGIWYRSHKIDAVLLCKSFDVWNLRNAAGCLYVHPRNNKVDFPDVLMRVPHAVTDETGTEWFEGIDFAQLLGMDTSGMFH